MRRARDLRDAADRDAAQTIAQALVPKVIVISVKAGQGGRLFGSVTAHDVADAVAEQTGIRIDRRKLHIDSPIKVLGQHSVTARLHHDVQFPITIDIVATA